MITLKAIKLAAIVMAHGHPRCEASTKNVLVAYCWARCIHDGSDEILVDTMPVKVAAVKYWLGY